MNKFIVKASTVALNILGACLLFYGLRQIDDFYEKVFEIASTGFSSVGAKITDFPPTITSYFGVLAAAVLCWWVADKISRRPAG